MTQQELPAAFPFEAVILRSEATKNLYAGEGHQNEILRFAQNDGTSTDKEA